jgi:hypothetical protein
MIHTDGAPAFDSAKPPPRVATDTPHHPVCAFELDEPIPLNGMDTPFPNSLRVRLAPMSWIATTNLISDHEVRISTTMPRMR